MADLSPWQALLLGIVQGITEWLPVSSSGHLVILQETLHIEVPVFFDLWLHVATLFVVVFHYRRRILAMAGAVLRPHEDTRPDRHLFWLLVVGTIPIVFVGLLFRDAIEAAFGSLRAVGFSLLLTTALLASTPLARRRDRFASGHAFSTGVFQALALLPGVSRSGATIAGAMHLGLDRERAADFAFLLFIPALLGAVVLLLPSAVQEGFGLSWQAYLVGGATAAAVGYASLRSLLFVVKRWGLLPFAPYTLVLGLWLLF